MFKNIIFDWSGTLVDDLALTLEASNYVFSQYGKPPLTRDEFRAEFQLPYPNYYASVLPGVDLEDLENHFRHAFRVSVMPVYVLPHAREFLEFCHKQGIRCFILTSVDPSDFDVQCRDLGMTDFFEGIHSGIRHKDTYIHQLLAQHGLLPSETAFVGDMQHDIHAAHCAGVMPVAVLTGYNDAAQLAQAEPAMTVPNLMILQDLLQRAGTGACHASDTISICDLEVPTVIGVPEEERTAPQMLLVTVHLTPRHPLHGLADDFSKTICYDTVAQTIKKVGLSRERKLVETMAEDIANACMTDFPIQHIQVTIKKFILPDARYIQVTVER